MTDKTNNCKIKGFGCSGEKDCVYKNLDRFKECCEFNKDGECSSRIAIVNRMTLALKDLGFSIVNRLESSNATKM